ncbi:MAG: AraC family transcriptional regulator [Polyangiaceae bacterium]
MTTSSAIASWGLAIAAALDARGFDSRSLMQRAGIETSQLESSERIPLATTTKLWRIAVGATADPCFGLAVAEYVKPNTFNALGFSLAASSTLRDAFQRIVRYFGMVTDAADLSFTPQGSFYELHIRLGEQRMAPEAVDALLAVGALLAKSLAGPNAKPLSVEVERAAPQAWERFTDFFGCPVHFSAPRNCLRFDRALCEAQLPPGNGELSRSSDHVAEHYLERFGPDSLARRVRAVLVELLPAGDPGPARVAKRLGTSLRSLQRHLAAEGTSYTALLERVRQELAESYLEETDTPLGSVAFLLGFSSASAFSRAFRRWNECSPSEYRAYQTRRESTPPPLENGEPAGNSDVMASGDRVASGM